MLGDLWNGFIDFLGDCKRFPGEVMKVNTISLKNLLACLACAGAGGATIAFVSWWGLVIAYLAIPALIINGENRQSILYIHTQLAASAIVGQGVGFGLRLMFGGEAGFFTPWSFLGMCITYYAFGKLFPERN